MWFLFIIFGFLSQPWTELRGYKQVQYIDISGLSPSYNYIRGWLISKTNPSDPLTFSAGLPFTYQSQFQQTTRIHATTRQIVNSLKDYSPYLLLLIGQNSPRGFYINFSSVCTTPIHPQ